VLNENTVMNAKHNDSNHLKPLYRSTCRNRAFCHRKVSLPMPV